MNLSKCFLANRENFGPYEQALTPLFGKCLSNQNLHENKGVWDFAESLGSRLVGCKYHEPEEPCGVSKRENPPCFW